MQTSSHQIGSRIDGLLAALWQAGGTDLLLTVGLPPMLRVDGSLTPVSGAGALTLEDTDSLLAEVLRPEQAAEAHRRLERGGLRGRLVLAF